MPATCPYPEPARSSPYPPTPHFLKIHLNIILPSMPGSPKWSLSLRFPHQNSVYASPLLHTRYMPRPYHSSRFYHPNNIGWGVQFIKLLIMPRKPYFVCGNGVLLARCLQISQYYLIWNGMNWRPVLPIRAVCSNKLSLYRQTLSYMTGKDSIRTAQ